MLLLLNYDPEELRELGPSKRRAPVKTPPIIRPPGCQCVLPLLARPQGLKNGINIMGKVNSSGLVLNPPVNGFRSPLR